MANIVFERKIYDKMLAWKQERQGKTALLIKGARRIGKSTIVRTFAEREYKSYILIDFSMASKAVTDLFEDLMNLDFKYFFFNRKCKFKPFAGMRNIVFGIFIHKQCITTATVRMTTNKNGAYIQHLHRILYCRGGR